MAVRLAALLPRAVVVALVWVLGTAAFTFAADTTIVGPSKPNPSAGAAAAQTELVVPSVSGQAYVFAKGILEDGGFAWRVTGAVHGYAANRVITQSPAAGTRVVDTGAPTVIVLRLVRGAYAQTGVPVDASPYRGTTIGSRAWQRRPSRSLRDEAGRQACSQAGAEARRRSRSRSPSRSRSGAASPRPPAFTRRRRAEGAARRDHAAGPRAPARALGRQPPEDERERPATGSTSTPGSSPAPSSAGGTAPRRSRP